ncbi:hypothetical protein POKO110462_19810 [Pontibacter korlensis]
MISFLKFMKSAAKNGTIVAFFEYETKQVPWRHRIEK